MRENQTDRQRDPQNSSPNISKDRKQERKCTCEVVAFENCYICSKSLFLHSQVGVSKHLTPLVQFSNHTWPLASSNHL